MSITYKDIAKKAGVSISTVSRVLNQTDLHKVGKATQKRVEKIIEKLDFTPNVIARSLVSRKTYNVAVAIKDLEDIINPYFNQVISGIAGVLERRGYFLQLVRTLLSKEGALSPYYLKAIQEKRVDGLILLSEEAKDKVLMGKERRSMIMTEDENTQEEVTEDYQPDTPVEEEPCEPGDITCNEMRDKIMDLTSDRSKYEKALDKINDLKETIQTPELDKIYADTLKAKEHIDTEIYDTFKQFTICTVPKETETEVEEKDL